MIRRLCQQCLNFLQGEHPRQGREQPREQRLFFEPRVVATSWPIQVGVFHYFFLLS